MVKFEIRLAEERDYPEIIEMIKSLAKFENAEDKVINCVQDMKNEKEFFGCFLAISEDNRIMGMALYFYSYFTWVGKSLYLDDLYVKPEYRGNGIGSSLIKEIFKLSKREKCKRLRWQVLNWNERAISLYQKFGATIDNEWSNCDFDSKAINEF